MSEPLSRTSAGPYLECTCGCGFTVRIIDITPLGEVTAYVADPPEVVIEVKDDGCLGGIGRAMRERSWGERERSWGAITNSLVWRWLAKNFAHPTVGVQIHGNGCERSGPCRMYCRCWCHHGEAEQ